MRASEREVEVPPVLPIYVFITVFLNGHRPHRLTSWSLLARSATLEAFVTPLHTLPTAHVPIIESPRIIRARVVLRVTTTTTTMTTATTLFPQVPHGPNQESLDVGQTRKCFSETVFNESVSSEGLEVLVVECRGSC